MIHKMKPFPNYIIIKSRMMEKRSLYKYLEAKVVVPTIGRLV